MAVCSNMCSTTHLNPGHHNIEMPQVNVSFVTYGGKVCPTRELTLVSVGFSVFETSCSFSAKYL